MDLRMNVAVLLLVLVLALATPQSVDGDYLRHAPERILQDGVALSVQSQDAAPRAANSSKTIASSTKPPTSTSTVSLQDRMDAAKAPAGTLRGCLNWDASEEYVRGLAKAFPEITEVKEIGKTVENRAITALCVGRCSESETIIDEDGNEVSKATNVPQAFLNGMHHSRECVSLMTIIKTLEKIFTGLANAANEDSAWAQDLVRTRRIWFVPVVNPDGYVYNEQQLMVNGLTLRHAMQRKNRASSDSSCISERVGVDLNRNYATCFFEDDKNDPRTRGASLNPCDEDYQGTAPFSEPETIAVKNLIESSNFTTALNVHSFGEFLLLPWSCKNKDMTSKESEYYLRLGRDFSGKNHFTTGHSYKMIGYAVDGDAADWMYDTHGIYAMSPEVGPGDAWVNAKRGRDGFWPDSNIVESLAVANIDMLLQASLAAGSYLRFADIRIRPLVDRVEVDLTVENAGLWHSWGSVRIFMQNTYEPKVTTVATTLDSLDAKYATGSGTLSFPRAALLPLSSAKWVFGIADNQDCIIYDVAVDLYSLKQEETAPELTGPSAYVRRYPASHEYCSIQDVQTRAPTKAAPAPSPSPNATKPSAQSSFEQLTDSVYAHPTMLITIVSLVTGACACFAIVRLRRRADDLQYQAVELGPIDRPHLSRDD